MTPASLHWSVAQVPIAVTVDRASERAGGLSRPCDEISGDQDDIEVRLQERQRSPLTDLSIGANISPAELSLSPPVVRRPVSIPKLAVLSVILIASV
jgi:hypothetical protein